MSKESKEFLDNINPHMDTLYWMIKDKKVYFSELLDLYANSRKSPKLISDICDCPGNITGFHDEFCKIYK